MPTSAVWVGGPCDRDFADFLCMPPTVRFRGSRMREIRTSGLMRGPEDGLTRPRSYSTVKVVRVMWRGAVPRPPEGQRNDL
jgi:hypothetical protein